MTKTEYRPDIDGLRALAVLAVIAFHAFPSALPGGFIGVDVFFVISGFLITTLIREGLQQQSFSFSAFYAGRIRRLFPSLIVVLIACQVFGWFALLSNEYKALGKHIAAAAVFIPNFIFWGESGYFDYAADAKPLLHLWSLGIEEQFYFFWPVVVWLGYRHKTSLYTLGVVLCLGSLAWSLMTIEQSPPGVFFSPITRMWELISGCLLAFFIDDKPRAVDPLKPHEPKSGSDRWTHPASALIGLSLLSLAALFFDGDLLYPGAWALVPVVGTCFIISAGNQSWINRAILSNRLMVWVGLISYPLYLWHWPLLSFSRIIEGGKPDWQIRLTLVVVSFVLAYLTYSFIERPIRYGKHLRLKTYALIITMSLVGTLGWATYLHDGFKSRTVDKVIEAQLADLEFDISDGEGWYCQNTQHDSPRCHSTGPNPSVVVMGDSHALTIYSGLRSLFNEKGQDIGLYGASDGCPPLLDVVIQDQGGDFRNCLKKGSQAIRRVITDTSIKEVLLTSRGPMYTTAKGFGDIELDQFGTWVLHFDGEEKGARRNEEVFASGLTKTLDALLSAGKKVTFLHDVPELGFDIRSCFSFRPMSITSKLVVPCAVSRKDFEVRTEAYRTMVNKILSERPEVKVIDLAEALCDEQWCFAAKGDVLFYIDDDHLSHRGADYVVRRLRYKF